MKYREPLVTKEMRYPQLSRRVKNMTNFILFLDVTTGRFQKLKPIISNPLLLFFLNLSWHVFYATMGFTMTESAQRFKLSPQQA
ncbi:MAG TPA: hypothetical protein ENI07_25365 [Desulfobacterales bacterium]|nr:hypothetical protein [Desulfobacterales bacterium]